MKLLRWVRSNMLLTIILLWAASILIWYFGGFKWLTSFWSLIGVYINIHKMKGCFIIWGFTNAAWAVIDFYHGLPEQGTLFTVYFCLAIYGLWQWHKEGKINEASSTYSEGSN